MDIKRHLYIASSFFYITHISSKQLYGIYAFQSVCFWSLKPKEDDRLKQQVIRSNNEIMIRGSYNFFLGKTWDFVPTRGGGRSDRISSFYQNLPIPNLPCKWEKFVLVLVHIVLLVLVFALLVNT